ncbi:HAMP domain-containing sensor histidine kinase [uncultured Imperialibacter sp.]|uniref:HAMP domain-containing sensor histidine kinase n=1 Tax=uncultured Imperialibacter sp. TaxID=1672639 RepID=UPI0030D70CAD
MASHVVSYKYLFIAALFGASAFFYWYFVGKSSKRGQEAYEQISERLVSQLQLIDSDLANAKSSGKVPGTLQSNYPIQIYTNRSLTGLSSNAFVPDYRVLEGDYQIQYLEWEGNKFIALKEYTERAGVRKEYVGVLPIYRNFPIENELIRGGYDKSIFDELRVFVYDKEVEGSFAFSYHDQVVCYFTIQSPPAVSSRFDRFLIFSLLSVAFVLGFFFFQRSAAGLAENGRPYAGIALLLAGVVFIRWLLLATNFPSSVYQFDLFNSRYLVISSLHKSLGDLMITAFLLAYFVYFTSNAVFRSDAYAYFSGASQKVKWLITIVVILLGYGFMGYTYLLLQEIFKNSQIHLDVNRSIHLDMFRMGTLVVYFLFCFSYFLIAHASYILLKHLRTGSAQFAWLVHLVMAAILFVAAIIIDDDLAIVPVLHAAYFSIIFWFSLPEFIRPIQFQAFLYFFLAAAFSSVLGSYSIYKYGEFERNVQKQKFANSLLIENDIQGEFQLDGIMKSIKSDIFILTRMMSPVLAKDMIKQRIKRLYMNSYFDKYDVQVSMYNSKGDPFPNEPGVTFSAIKETYDKPIYKTDYQNIFFESNFSPGSTKRYVCFIGLERYDKTIGYIVLQLRLKKYLPSTVYPRLLVDERFMNEPADENYSYGIYEGTNLRYKSGTFNYITNLPQGIFDRETLYATGLEINGFHHLGIKGSREKRIIITSPMYEVSWMVSNFSFLFLVLIGGIALTVVFNALEVRFANTGLTLASKIQIYLSIAFFLPLVVVTVATLSAINNSYKEDIDKQYMKKAESVNGYLVSLMDNYISNVINKEVLSNELTDIARFSQADINLFSVNGKLMASSQQTIYDDKLLSEYINPEALRRIREDDGERIILSESLGALNYKSTYLAIKSFNDASLLGIMSMPFFESRAQQQNQQIEVFTNIINIFTFIFIISLVISFMASRVLTNPLRIITSRLRKTTFNETNEPIHWNTSDEIGLLVAEYNSMLVKLETSRAALVRSEKESAWKEIAQQVAHEIKNPLTPMKLTLQHMRRLADDKDEGLKKSIDNLLRQIDNLSDIVTSFSTFAKLPAPDPSRFDISGLLGQLVQLHSKPGVDFVYQSPIAPVFVVADEKMLSGIFTNLIINACQAMEGRPGPRLEIGIRVKEKEAEISFKDNGIGIAEDIQDKVFVPSFSTKQEGSGIGLALARRGVEQAGGSIWFETVHGYGTTFYVSLPLG